MKSTQVSYTSASKKDLEISASNTPVRSPNSELPLPFHWWELSSTFDWGHRHHLFLSYGLLLFMKVFFLFVDIFLFMDVLFFMDIFFFVDILLFMDIFLFFLYNVFFMGFHLLFEDNNLFQFSFLGTPGTLKISSLSWLFSNSSIKLRHFKSTDPHITKDRLSISHRIMVDTELSMNSTARRSSNTSKERYL